MCFRPTMLITPFFLFLMFSVFSLPVFATNTLEQNPNGTIDANLVDADIDQVFEFFTEKYGILFKKAGSIPPLTVSSVFRNKDTEEALRILLSQINYALVYNASGGIVEVTLFNSNANIVESDVAKPQGLSNTTSSPMQTGTKNNRQPLQQNANPVNEITTFVPHKAMPGGEPNINGKPFPVDDDITTFKPIRNAPPPGQ